MIQLFSKLKIKVKEKKIVQYLIKSGVGTKNLPDAIKWHFAFFWEHAITKDQLKNTIHSKNFRKIYCYTYIFKCQLKKLQKNFIKPAQNYLVLSFLLFSKFKRKFVIYIYKI